MFLFGCYYRPKRSFGQGNIFTGVCDSVLFTGRGVSGLGGGSSKFSGWGVEVVPPNFRGFWGGEVLQIWGGVSGPGGCSSKFFGGGSSKFSGEGGSSKFSGGVLQIFFGRYLVPGGCSSKFSGGGSPPEYGQCSASTHPTGMHSCFNLLTSGLLYEYSIYVPILETSYCYHYLSLYVIFGHNILIY